MNVVIIIFMIVSTLFAVASLGYVAVDVVIEIKTIEAQKKANEEKKEEPVVEEPVVVEEEPEETLPDAVDNIDAEEADRLLSDSLALRVAIFESGAGHGQQGIVNIGVINENFDANDVITLAELKAKGLVPKKVGRVKILAGGSLNKPLTIKAESYSIEAIKMIALTGGTVVILKG